MQNFEKSIKKSKAFTSIMKDKDMGSLLHAYLISCNDNNLSSEFCIVASKLIMCDNNLCNTCNTCKKIDENHHPDVKIIDGKNESIKVEQINDLVQDTYIRAYEGNKKVYIILNIENMTIQAQNKLLKTLEEPPVGVHFLLTTTNEYSLLPTIVSRCKKVNLTELNSSQIYDELKQMGYSSAISTKCAEECLHNTSTAIELASDTKSNLDEIAIDMLINMNSSKDILKHSTKFINTKNNLPKLIDFVIMFTRDTLMQKIHNSDLIENKQRIIEIDKISFFSTECLNYIISFCNEAQKMIKLNVNNTAVVDNLLLKIAEVKVKCK